MDIKRQKRIQKHFEKMYQAGLKPWTWHSKKPVTDDFLQLLLQKHPKAKILDIGCGDGWASVEAAKKGFEVWGIDSSKTAIKEAEYLAKKSGVEKNVHFQTGDALNLPFKDSFFNALLDRGLLHHILPENRPLYFENILRVLKSKSLMYLAVFSKKNPKLIGHLFDLKAVKKLFIPYFNIIYFRQDPYPTLAPAHIIHFIMERI